MHKIKILLLFTLGMLFFSNFTYSKPKEYLRKWPYPHSHAMSFTSDVDMQEAWFGEAFHKQINENLGLLISDSMWFQVATPLSGILYPNLAFNRSNNQIGSRGTFFLLLQQWHRGNIDHIHSWQDDVVPNHVLFDSGEGKEIGNNTTELVLNEISPSLRGYPFANIQFYFSERPPESFSITLIDNNGHRAEISSLAVKQASSFQLVQKEDRYSLNFLIGNNINPLIKFSSNLFLLSQIKFIQFRNIEKKLHKNMRIFKIEVGNISRESISYQSKDLSRFNLFPTLLTSHGGSTWNQNFCRKRHEYIHKAHDSIQMECLADVRDCHVYHMDILRDMGLLVIWPFGKEYYLPPHKPARLKANASLDIYLLERTHNNNYDNYNKNYYLKELGDEKYINDINLINELIVTHSEMPGIQKQMLPFFTASQGSQFGTYVYYAISGAKNGQSINHMWYTHFGTIPYIKEFCSTSEKPLPDHIMNAAKKLSEYFYNFSNNRKLNERIWVIPASTHIRYMMIHPNLTKNAKIDFDGSNVEIFSYEDKTIKTKVPDPHFGTRDLHGITYYLRDPEKAKVFIDGKETFAFTRNPVDNRGLPSISIFDDHLPTEIIPGNQTLVFQGKLVKSGIILNADDENIHIISDKDGEVYIEYEPYELNLWNISHVMLDWAVKKDVSSRIFIELTRADGQIVGLYENIEDASAAQAFWTISPYYNKIGLAQDQLNFKISYKDITNLPLLLGNIKKLKIGFHNAKKGDMIQIRSFEAFRPNGNDSSRNNNLVIGGQIVDSENHPRVGEVVTLKYNNGLNELSTISDQQGYFVFFDIAKGSIVELNIDHTGGKVFPTIGSKFKVLKNELEINFIFPDKKS